MVALKVLAFLSVTTAIRLKNNFLHTSKRVAHFALRQSVHNIQVPQSTLSCVNHLACQRGKTTVQMAMRNLPPANQKTKDLCWNAFEAWSFYQGEKLWADVKNAMDGKSNGKYHIFTFDIQYLFKDIWGKDDLPPPMALSDRGSSRETAPFDVMISLAQIFKDPQANMEKWDILFGKMHQNQMTKTIAPCLKNKEPFQKKAVANSVKEWALDQFPKMWTFLKGTRKDVEDYLTFAQSAVMKVQIDAEAKKYKEKLKEKLKEAKIEVDEAEVDLYMNAILNETFEMMLMTDLFVEKNEE